MNDVMNIDNKMVRDGSGMDGRLDPLGQFKLLRLDAKEAGLVGNGGKTVNCAVVSSGCKLNQFEASQFETLLKRLNPGLKIMEPDLSGKKNGGRVDLFLVNTCTVTEKADTETNRIIRKIRKNYPESRLILTGCSAQLNRVKLTELSGVTIIDNEKKAELLKAAADSFPDAVLNQNRVRPYLKIQEGCVLNCAYCIIPKARPAKWSMDIKSVLNYIEKFEKIGFKEVILTGVNIGSYGNYGAGSGAASQGEGETAGARLKELLTAIEETKGRLKIRLSSIDPVYVDDELIDIFAKGKRIQNHFHIPLQSASVEILKSMNRHYSFADYMHIACRIKEKVAGAAIGTDIISGFPGETDEDFAETAENLKKLPIYYIHAFSYSDRPGTVAYSLKQKTDEKEIKKRTGIVREISEGKRAEFHKNFDNKMLEFLSMPGNKALSSNYIKASIKTGGGSGSGQTAPGKLFLGRLEFNESESGNGNGGISRENILSVAIENFI